MKTFIDNRNRWPAALAAAIALCVATDALAQQSPPQGGDDQDSKEQGQTQMGESFGPRSHADWVRETRRKAFEDTDWLGRVANAYPNEILVAADVRDRRVVTHGWTRTLPREIVDVTEELSALPLAGLLVTAVHREGRMQGTDLFLMEDVVEAANFPVYASGGIASVADLRALADRGVAAAVVGMALYTGAIDPWHAAEEFAE